MSQKYQVTIPQNYDPRVNISFFNPRSCWRYTCTLPTQEEIRYTGYISKKIVKTEKQAKSFRDFKRDELKKGILNENEYKKILDSSSESDLTFQEAIDKYIEITKITKTPNTVQQEKTMYPAILSYFTTKYEFTHIKQVKEKHILEYKEYLLHEASKRKDVLDLLRPLLTNAKSKEEKLKITKKIRKTGISPATAKNYFKYVIKFFNKLYESKKILSNPVNDFKQLKISVSDAVRSKTFDPADLVKIANCGYIHPEGFPTILFFLFLAETGARRSEGLHLEWDDYDPKTRIWKIKEKPNCPARDRIGWKPKWGKEREVYLSDSALKILSMIPRVQSVGYVIVGQTKNRKGRKINIREAVPANFVFTVKDELTGNYRRVDGLRRSWVSLLEKAGVGEVGFDQFIIHDFRRYKNVISDCIQNMSLAQRSSQLGNTERVNATHYMGEASHDLIAVKGQIQGLTSKNLVLEAEIKMLREENTKLKTKL